MKRPTPAQWIKCAEKLWLASLAWAGGKNEAGWGFYVLALQELD